MKNFKSLTFKYWIAIYYYNNKLILSIVRSKLKIVKYIILGLIFPYLLINYLCSIIYEKIIGIKYVNHNLKMEKNIKFRYELAIVVSSKNEGPYLLEWIEYYKLLGANKIYFYDNGSDDNTRQLLNQYIENEYVEYTYVEGRGKQLYAYNDALQKHKLECRWMAFIDMDEYILPTEPYKPISQVISEIVDQAGGGAAGVAINWATFGTSGHIKSPEGLITSNYTRRAYDKHWMNKHIKTICNPRFVSYYISAHYPIYRLGAYSVEEATGRKQICWSSTAIEYKNIRINHYRTKSAEDYLRKCNRGLGDRNGFNDYDRLKDIDYDDVTDTNALIYKEDLEKALHL